MRRIFLVALISSLSTTAFAQSHDLPSPDAATHYAKHPGHAVASSTGKTELQKEAERVAAYRRAQGLDTVSPMPLMPPSAESAPTAQHPLAPNGIENISLYNTPASVSMHMVAKGDTLYNISKRYGVGVIDLKQANQLSGSGIMLGQSLLIPAQKQAVLASANAQAPVTVMKVTEPVAVDSDDDTQLAKDPTQRRITIYAVAPGDTIAAISRRTCVPEDLLITENSLLNPDVLRPGHRLALPDDHCLAN